MGKKLEVPSWLSGDEEGSEIEKAPEAPVDVDVSRVLGELGYVPLVELSRLKGHLDTQYPEGCPNLIETVAGWAANGWVAKK